MTTVTTVNAAVPAGHRERPVQFARQVPFEAGARLFGEGRRADPFWIVRTGAVALDLHEPGRRPAAVEMLRHGELVGLSWHFPPRMGQLGAEAVSPVRTWESDAEAVRAVYAEDPEFGFTITVWLGLAVTDRLDRSRTRLLDLYAPQGNGGLA
ncbi:cyclic nucleotide-binding domain-containing protein [Streptomyces sp. NBC_00649]|uniref:cyclic nucleotide-binding domain-containing protein n=1 Tax=unclassified Streptomyces TaxID=2593676 RepID=UPI0032565F96